MNIRQCILLVFLLWLVLAAASEQAAPAMEERAHPRVMIQRAERFLALGKTEAAIVWYKKVLECCEGTADAAEAHNDLGVAYSRKGLDQEALKEYEASLAINGYPLARFNLGKALLRLHEAKADPDLRERAMEQFRMFKAHLESGEPLPPVAASQREEIEAWLEQTLGSQGN